jgi:hypothetical protein
MTEPQSSAPQTGEPVDVEVDPADVEEGTPETTPTSSAAGYEEGDTAGGTGGLDAGGAG